jgi:hypothetical protein
MDTFAQTSLRNNRYLFEQLKISHLNKISLLFSLMNLSLTTSLEDKIFNSFQQIYMVQQLLHKDMLKFLG